MMSNKKLKKTKAQKHKADSIDPDHFTVYELMEGWKTEASKYNSQETIEAFKKSRELLKIIPEAIRVR